MFELNATHDPQRRSWLASANTRETPFPIQNLPLGVFLRDGVKHVGVAIGAQIFDLTAAQFFNLFNGDALIALQALRSGTLNDLMAMPESFSSALRSQVSEHLSTGSSTQSMITALSKTLFMDQAAVSMCLPAHIGDYSDFLTSLYHTERHGRFKGLKDPLPAAFKSLPIAYHGRASSIRVSGTPVIRPQGQYKSEGGEVQFGPAPMMDFELELAAFVGQGNALGEPIALKNAHQHLFGYCLLNDWSAKSIQWWEQVLGPFLGKSFMSSISPWVVSAEALRPFREKPLAKGPKDPPLLPYLSDPMDQEYGGLAIEVEAFIRSGQQQAKDLAAQRISKSHLKHLYWTFGQMIAHHSSNGCNMNPGDLIGSGTISGPSDESRACITEITEAGKKPLQLTSGEQRTALEDGDEITLRAWAKRDGYVAIGFGDCVGKVLPAKVT
jgi:fumarylacetoacetase